MAIGYATRMSLAARRTFSMSCSKGNSGVWTPITTSPSSRYFFAHARRYGRVRSQLMQVKVQKSTATTLPRKPAGVSGGELSHAFAPVNAGRLPSIGNSAARALSRRNRSASGETSAGAGTPGRWVAANGNCLVFMLDYPTEPGPSRLRSPVWLPLIWLPPCACLLDDAGPARRVGKRAVREHDGGHRSDLKAARISVEKSSGCPQAAKWLPLPTSLK